MKYAFIDQEKVAHPVRQLCDALGVSRSGYYEWQCRQPSKRAQVNQKLLDKIKALFQTHKGRYGSPRIYQALRQQGEKVSLGRVERLMRKHQLIAHRSARHKRIYIQRIQQQAVDNHLDRQFYADQPNQKWVSDITFIPTAEGFLYLAIVLDLYSRAIIGWSMNKRNNADLVLDALTMATTQRGKPQGVLVHSDQGSQYTAEVYQNRLREHQMQASMSRKGECHDNAVAESFFKTLKEELVKENKYQTRAEAKQSIFKYIELYYNRQRMHSSLGYHAPLQYERMQAVA